MSFARVGISIFLLSVLVGCSTTTPAPTLDTAAIFTKAYQTALAALPTNTPTLPPSTNTPQPTVTPTPQPQPIVFTGSGDQVVDISAKWAGLAILHITGPNVYDNFAVFAYDTSGQKDLLVNTIGAYDGYVPIQLLDSDLPVVRLQITSGGDWRIEILPLTPNYIQAITAPGKFDGKGDNLLVVRGTSSTISAKCNKQTNFVIYSLSASSGRELLFNEIGPYEGTKVFPNDSFLLVIKGECEWTIELK